MPYISIESGKLTAEQKKELIDLSFASNDFLRQRHKKTTWILA